MKSKMGSLSDKICEMEPRTDIEYILVNDVKESINKFISINFFRNDNNILQSDWVEDYDWTEAFKEIFGEKLL